MVADLTRRQQWMMAGVGVVLAVLGALDWATRPPPVPDMDWQRGHWQSSKAWLYDRHGEMLEEVRIDFGQQRLGWVRLSDLPRIRPPCWCGPRTSALPAMVGWTGGRWAGRCAIGP
jgi:hypothetical protein